MSTHYFILNDPLSKLYAADCAACEFDTASAYGRFVWCLYSYIMGRFPDKEYLFRAELDKLGKLELADAYRGYMIDEGLA